MTAAAAAPMSAVGVLPALITALFPTHDLAHLYPAPPAPKEDAISKAIALFDDIGMGLDFVDFAWSVGLMPLSRGITRMLTGYGGKPDFGLHILYLPWTALATAANEHTLRRFHVQVRHVCASSKGYWLAVGSLQAAWAVAILTRTMTGRPPHPWANREL